MDAKATNPRSAGRLLLILPVLWTMTGCGMGGGPLSQAELKRMAIRRKTDPEPPPTVQPVAKQPPVNNAPVSAAAPQPPAGQRGPAIVAANSGPASRTPTPSHLAATPSAAEPTRSDKPPVALPEPDPGELLEGSNNASDRPEQPQQRSLDNMKRIGRALTAYVQEHREFPAQAIRWKGSDLLSWRVALLPYLGYDKLFAQFHLQEAWDSPHNQRLLALIPPEFQAPHRSDPNTNYLAVVGSNTAIRPVRAVPLRHIEDGLYNTLVVVEVDDTAALPWTKPADYSISADLTRPHLGTLRGEQFFGLWADGGVDAIGVIDDRQWKAMFSVDGGEVFHRSQLVAPRAVDVPVASTIVAPSSDSQTSAANEADVASSPSPGDEETGTDYQRLAWKPGLPEDEVFLLLHAARVLNWNKDIPLPEMRWVKALQRPVLAIRWGVGVRYAPLGDTRGDAQPIKQDALPSTRNSDSVTKAPQSLTKYTGELGQRLWSQLRARGADGDFGAPIARLHAQVDPAPRSKDTAPGLVLLQSGMERELILRARREQLDLLALFEVTTKSTRSGNIHNTTVLRLLDVDSGRTLYATRSLNNIQVQNIRHRGIKDDPVEEQFRDLRQFVETELRLLPASAVDRGVQLPSQITLRAAADGHEKLRMFSELIFYHRHEIISPQDFQEMLALFLSPDEWETVRAGDSRSLEVLITSWLEDSC